LRNTCRDASTALSHSYKLPLLLKAILEKTATDSTFRATTLNILRYIVKHRDPGRAILQRLTRKSY